MIEDRYINVGTTFIGNVNNEEFTITKIEHSTDDTKVVCYNTKNGNYSLGYETFRRLNARVKHR